MNKKLKGVLVGIFALAAGGGAAELAFNQTQTTLKLFPTGEQALEELRIPATELPNLSNNPVWVKNKNFWGKLHDHLIILKYSPLRHWGHDLSMVSNDNIAFAYSFGDDHSPCSVTLAHPEQTISDLLSMSYKISSAMIERDVIPPIDVRRITLAHEISHCHSDNRINAGISAHFAEITADEKALPIVAPYLEHEETVQAWTYFRALVLKSSSTHDTALILDEEGRNLIKAKLFPRQEIAKATERVFKEVAGELANLYKDDVLHGRMIRYNYDFRYAVYYSILTEKLARGAFEDAPLAKRRAELYVEAVEYFSPNLAKSLQKAIETRKQHKAAPGFTP